MLCVIAVLAVPSLKFGILTSHCNAGRGAPLSKRLNVPGSAAKLHVCYLLGLMGGHQDYGSYMRSPYRALHDAILNAAL